MLNYPDRFENAEDFIRNEIAANRGNRSIQSDTHVKETFFNRANALYGEQIACNDCFERAVFHMKDTAGHEFSVGLSTIIECLIAAVQNGDLPKLPESWIHNIEAIYYVPDEERANVSYRD